MSCSEPICKEIVQNPESEHSQQQTHANNGAAVTDRSPVHVVYGGADRFSSETPAKFGAIALKTVAEYAPADGPERR